VIHEVDLALTALLRDTLAEGTDILFESPSPEWTARTGPRAVSLFLHAVREDLDGRQASWQDSVDDRGRVLARRPSPRRYRLCYLATCWADSVTTEHGMLAAVLAGLTAADVVPERHVTGRLSPPVHLAVAHPDLPTVPIGLWHALGVVPRTGLDVVVTATLQRAPDTGLATAPGTVDLGVAGTVPRPPTPERQLPAPTGRIRE
jgi:hypothetical protein